MSGLFRHFNRFPLPHVPLRRFIAGALVFTLLTPFFGAPASPSSPTLNGWTWTYARPSLTEVVTAAIILLQMRDRQHVSHRTPSVQCQRFLVPEAIRVHQRPGGFWNVDLGYLERCLIPRSPGLETRFVHVAIQLAPTPGRSLKTPFGLKITRIREFPSILHAIPSAGIRSHEKP